MSARDNILGILPVDDGFIKKEVMVDGIYMKNHQIRKQMLSQIWGAYNMLPDMLTRSLGKLYNTVADVYIPPKNMKNLYSYTHDGSSVYSQRIKEKFITNGSRNNTLAELTTIPKDGYNLWSKKYYEYESINYASFLGIEKVKDNKEKSWSYTQNSIDDIRVFNYDEGDTKNNYLDYDYEEYIGSLNSPLLKKTIDLYKNHRIQSLYSRYHTSNEIENENNFIDTAKTRVGNSHGRNLLKKGFYSNNLESKDKYGYDNPYCRVWTHHKQYKTFGDTIRSEDFISQNFSENGEIEKIIKQEYRYNNGNITLPDVSVLQNNGLVRITPRIDSDIKKCMFSITNKANNKSMWFPPYGLTFQESVNVDWDKKTFIGRGEPIYTYTQTHRSGTLSFILLIDHPTILNHMSNANTTNGEDYENEILRFFAGCGNIELSRGSLKNDVTNNDQTSDIKENTILNDEVSITKKFAIYFPNNYSGNGGKDDDWAKYLYEGKFTKNSGDIGYEMNEEKGLNDGVTTYYDMYNYVEEYGILNTREDCGLVNVKDIDREDEKEGLYWFYRVDEDKKDECLTMIKNYYDTNSHMLNSLNYDYDYTFSDVYEYFLSGPPLTEDVEKITEESLTLADIFDGGSKVKINVTGFAPLNNKNKNSETSIAAKRAKAVKKWIENNIDGINIEIKDSQTVDVGDDTDINSENNKKARRVEVEIFYGAPLQEYATIKSKIEGEDFEQVASDSAYRNVSLTDGIVSSGYTIEDEYNFFQQVTKDTDFTLKRILDKVKYFSPAYHSITPEGFNSRLNFLHQCTRQGSSVTNGESTNNVAGNSAFGAPPFCELRIGDFINTNIVINSLNINYENNNGIQWDLNPEGVGVQPMYAHITMGIDIIGGQSLVGPVQMLNNAVSNNFYANTGVYAKAEIATNDQK